MRCPVSATLEKGKEREKRKERKVGVLSAPLEKKGRSQRTHRSATLKASALRLSATRSFRVGERAKNIARVYKLGESAH